MAIFRTYLEHARGESKYVYEAIRNLPKGFSDEQVFKYIDTAMGMDIALKDLNVESAYACIQDFIFKYDQGNIDPLASLTLLKAYASKYEQFRNED